jgi:hypothetical protein
MANQRNDQSLHRQERLESDRASSARLLREKFGGYKKSKCVICTIRRRKPRNCAFFIYGGAQAPLFIAARQHQIVAKKLM